MKKSRKQAILDGLSESDYDFYVGVISALAVIKLFDHETCYHEIINTMDKDELIAVALDDEGRVEWAGLDKYGYVKAGGWL